MADDTAFVGTMASSVYSQLREELLHGRIEPDSKLRVEWAVQRFGAGVGGLWAGVIGGLITAWLRLATVILGVQPTAQYIVFGVIALVAEGLTTDRGKIGVIK